MAGWTSHDIVPLDGKVAIVTGANSGLGLYTAESLASHGAHVVLACRNQTKGAEAAGAIRSVAPSADVELASIDLADLASIRAFSEDVAAKHGGVDILVNNAGVMGVPRATTADGFEMQFGTNHLGHFALTGLLLDALLARPSARVVTVSSSVARTGKLRWDDLQRTQRYNRWAAYGQAKLANQYFMLELDRRVRRAGVDLISVASHPGYAATNLQTSSNVLENVAFRVGNMVAAQSAAAGAMPSLYAATAPGVTGGQYFGPSQFFESRGSPKPVQTVKEARDPDGGRRLWDISEELTGVTYGKLDDT